MDRFAKNKNEKLVIILPIYNPHPGWVGRFKGYMSEIVKNHPTDSLSVTLVNDGSNKNLDTHTIKTLQEEFSFLDFLSYSENQGKGNAIRYGLQHTDGTYFVYSDYDFPFGVKTVFDTFNSLKKDKVALVIGKRASSYYKILPLKRRIISRSLQVVNAFLTRFKVTDTQAGLKGIDQRGKKVLLSTTTNSFIFEIEFIRKILKQKLPYSFITIHIREGIFLTNFGQKTIAKEFKNLIKVILNT